MQAYSNLKNKLTRPNTGLFLIRVVLGIIFIAHGWSKLQGMEGTIGFFKSIGLGEFVAYAVSLIEFLGGLSMILGVGTAVFGVLLSVVMFGAMMTVKADSGLTGPGGFELDIALLAMSLGIVLSGPGKYTIWKGASCDCKDGACQKGCNCGCHGKCDGCEGCKGGCTGHESK